MNKRILAIGAHFDDIEIGLGGTILNHIERGDKVFMLVATNSGYDSRKDHKRDASDALREGSMSAKMLGAELVTLDYPTLKLKAADELIFDIKKITDEIKPNRIYTQSVIDCNLDHVAVGEATLAACRDCPQILSYRSNNYMVEKFFHPNFFVDISKFITQKENILKIFKSEWPKPKKWIRMSRALADYYGGISGTEYSEGFSVIKFVE